MTEGTGYLIVVPQEKNGENRGRVIFFKKWMRIFINFRKYNYDLKSGGNKTKD